MGCVEWPVDAASSGRAEEVFAEDMADPAQYRINRPAVIHETLDDELVIVNLKSGAYFSLDPVGAAVWQEIDRGAAVDEIVVVVSRRFEGDAAAISAGVNGLIEELRREELIAPGTSARPATADAATSANGRRLYATPVLEKFTDMQDLLLLDPIHEVDETGWPARKT